MALVEDDALSPTSDITTDPELPEQWWINLRTALMNLSVHSTDRVSMGQTHLTRRIHEVYGTDIDTTITDWACAHGDLGYANPCGPRLSITDWESWGMGPAGWDEACLWSASLTAPTLAERVQALFSTILSTRSGKLPRLLLCANVERAFQRTGRKAPLTDTMADVTASLFRDLR
ncbi:hypothetical protein [Streptomyces sp. NPDC097610]|uniref:hypothetical protein n=1 Tax=Streptomyces sp. NPDC097610 TaxID=3157227 RepID=UPI00332A98FD